MDGVPATALVAAVAFLLGLMLWAAVTTFRRMWNAERPLLFGDMLKRQGAEITDAAASGTGGEFANAVRRCAACGVQKSCGEFLDKGGKKGYEQFCPNAAYIERLKGRA